jgi:hypothetical protein
VSDIFREIDEELRRDNAAKLWKRYGNYVLAVVIVIVLVTAGVVLWRQYQERLRAADGQRFQVALDLVRQGKTKEANEAFGALAANGDRRSVLARFEEAAATARAGDPTKAAAAYDVLAGDSSLDPTFRDLATILAAQYGLAKSADPKALIARLQPLAAGEGPWHPSALELTALAQLKAGDKAAAHASYQRLADDLGAPQAMRSRATEMVAALAQ